VATPIEPDEYFNPLNPAHIGFVAVGLFGILNYGEHGRTFPTGAPTPVLIRTTSTSDHPRRRLQIILEEEGVPTFTPPHRVSSSNATTIASVSVSPVRAASSRASRSASGSLMLSAIVMNIEVCLYSRQNACPVKSPATPRSS
jgi:hypothetical protein